MNKDILEVVEGNSKLNICISTTAKESSDFKVLPLKKIGDTSAINILISENEKAKKLFHLLDGKVERVFIDIEKKKPIDLWHLAKKQFTKSEIFPIKPNDAALEAAYVLINRFLNFDLDRKKFLIIGAGNIGSKLALRLSEANGGIFLFDRDSEKCEYISIALNRILPEFSDGFIKNVGEVFNKEKFKAYFDCLVSFVSSERTIGKEYLNYLKEDSFAIDGGINNFSHEFIKKSAKKNIFKLRLDVRIGYLYNVLYLDNRVEAFFNDIMGKKVIDGIKIVSGGVIGEKGDIVVDKIKKPEKVIGVANGTGGLYNEIPSEFNVRKKIIEEKIKQNNFV